MFRPYHISDTTERTINKNDNLIEKLSSEDYYNDLSKYPEKIIHLKCMGIIGNTEYYKDDKDIIYTRENFYPRENVARWWVHGHKLKNDSGDEVRPNLIFEYKGQTEKVVFVNSCGGIAACDNMFNKNFNSESYYFTE